MKQEKVLFAQSDTVSDAARFCIASHLKDRDQLRASALYDRLARSQQAFIAI
jgi:hypothetical protein